MFVAGAPFVWVLTLQVPAPVTVAQVICGWSAWAKDPSNLTVMLKAPPATVKVPPHFAWRAALTFARPVDEGSLLQSIAEVVSELGQVSVKVSPVNQLPLKLIV